MKFNNSELEQLTIKSLVEDLDGQSVRSPTKLKKQSVKYKKDIQKVNAKRNILLK